MKRHRGIIIISLSIYLIIMILYLKVPAKTSYIVKPGNSLIKLHLYHDETTGPSFYLKEDEPVLKKVISDKYPGTEINTSELQITNNDPYGLVDYPPDLGHEITVYGEVVGLTDMYKICGSGVIPVFEVSYYELHNPSFPYNYVYRIIQVALPVPLIIIILVYVYKRVRNKQHSKP